MTTSTLRFDRDYKYSSVRLDEFVIVASQLSKLISAWKPFCQTEVLTCEDGETYACRQSSFEDDVVTERSEQRNSYQVDELSNEIWEKSLHLSLVIKTEGHSDTFMILLSVDRRKSPKKMSFFGQGLDLEQVERIIHTYAAKSGWYNVRNLSKY